MAIYQEGPWTTLQPLGIRGRVHCQRGPLQDVLLLLGGADKAVPVAKGHKAKALGHACFLVKDNVGRSDVAELREVLPQLPFANCPR